MHGQERLMCRNIKPLFNYEPQVSDEEVREAALQFVRKISGYAKPSQVNAAAFHVHILFVYSAIV